MPNKRLEIAIRRNKAKHLQSSFIEDLAGVLARPTDSIRILDLDDSDSIWLRFKSKFQDCTDLKLPCFRKRWVEDDVVRLQHFLEQLRNLLNNEPLVLFRSQSEYCGAIETNTREVFDRALRLVSLDQEELIALDKQTSKGVVLSLDTDKYVDGAVVVYELFIWGAEWLAAIDSLAVIE